MSDRGAPFDRIAGSSDWPEVKPPSALPDKRRLTDEYVKRVKAELAAMGYVVIKESSYKAAQERQRIAKVRMENAIEDRQSQRDWLDRDVFPWERHLMNRVDHLAGLAGRLGATAGDFVGPPCGCGSNGCPS